jgi:histidyl-tRNA synthetase
MTAAAGASPEQAAAVLRLASLSGSNDEVLRQLSTLVAGSALGEAGVARLEQILAGVHAAEPASQRIVLDVAIARGLDYYTGVVFETFLDDLPTIGSICSGGRYDNLAGLYTQQDLPGIGASLGLDRLLAAMEELGMVEKVRTPAPVFVAFFDDRRLGDYLRLAGQLRGAGLGVEVYPDSKKLGQQLKYADQRGFRVALIAGQREFDANVCQVKNLQTGDSQECALAEGAQAVIAAVRRIVG